MALPPNNNYLYGNTNLPYENNNQIAFAPDSKKDKTIKTLYENKDMYGDTPAYKQLRERDVEQFNKGKEPLSLPPEEYKGIKGYTANAAGYPRATMTDANNIFNTGQRTTPNSSAINFGNAFNYFNEDFFNQPNTGITGAKMNLEEEFNPTQYLASNDIAMRNARLAPNDSRFSGIMRNVARGPLFQGGAMAGNAIGSALGMANPLFALAGGIGSQFLNLSNRPSDLDYDYVNQPGGISVVDNKIRGGVLEGKNFASGYGSNNLGTMYQDYIDTMKGRGMVEDEFGNLVFDEDELTDGQGKKLDDAQKQLNAYLSTGRKMSGYETPDGKRMTDREFAFNYNQGIGQFAQPDYDKLDTQSYTGSTDSGGLGGGEFTDSMGNTDYNDPYDPGGGE